MLKKINKKEIVYRTFDLLLLIPFAYFPKYNILHQKLDMAFEIYSVLVFALIWVIYFKSRKTKISIIVLLIGLMFFIPFVVTITYGDQSMFKYAFKIFVGSISIVFLIDYNISFRKEEFLKSMLIFWGILALANVFSFFLFYPGVWSEQDNYYFLGNDNGTIYESFIYIYLSIVYYNVFKKKIPIYFYLILAFIFAGYLYVKSGNGMVCMLITILFVAFYKNKYVKKLFQLKFLIPIFLMLFFTIVIFRNNILIQFVMNILDKNPTISGRTHIWDKCWNFIGEHPLLGNGYENEIIMEAKIGNSKLHNIILQYLYNGGIAMLSLFLTIVGIVLNKIRISKIDINLKNIMIFSVFLYFIISIFDFYVVKFTTLIMLMTYYYLTIDKQKTPKK